MEKLEISQSLIRAIIHKNPLNIFYAITAEIKRNKRVTDRQEKCYFYKKLLFSKVNLNMF